MPARETAYNQTYNLSSTNFSGNLVEIKIIEGHFSGKVSKSLGRYFCTLKSTVSSPLLLQSKFSKDPPTHNHTHTHAHRHICAFKMAATLLPLSAGSFWSIHCLLLAIKALGDKTWQHFYFFHSLSLMFFFCLRFVFGLYFA